MKFYNRNNELVLLQQIEERSKRTAQMTFVVGPSGVGKTSLLVGLNDLEKSAIIAEVKRKKDNISLPKLMEKSKSLEKSLQGYHIHYIGLSLEDL